MGGRKEGRGEEKGQTLRVRPRVGHLHTCTARPVLHRQHARHKPYCMCFSTYLPSLEWSVLHAADDLVDVAVTGAAPQAVRGSAALLLRARAAKVGDDRLDDRRRGRRRGTMRGSRRGRRGDRRKGRGIRLGRSVLVGRRGGTATMDIVYHGPQQ